MASRHEDWMRQAKKDLEHSRHSLEDGDYEWACFAAQQAAEKAVKAVYQKIGADAWGHTVAGLLQHLPPAHQPLPQLIDMAKDLDRHYIPSRYTNAYPTGAPMDYYTEGEARRAIENAQCIIQFCESQMV